jgi:hypothetical protein
MRSMRVSALAILLAASVGVVASRATAQTPTKVVRVRVTDPIARPIARADVSLMNGMSVINSASTDRSGVHYFRLPRDRRDYDLVVRSIGYERADRFFTSTGNDTLDFDITMHRVVPKLATVEVSAAVRGQEHDYNIGADEIAKSSRYLGDVNDIIRKLRPMMFSSRAPEVCNGSLGDPTPALSNVWVNGQQVPTPKIYQINEKPTTPAFMAGHASAASSTESFGADTNFIIQQISETLRLIKPEHIAEMHYLDCLDHSMADPDSRKALYIVLKPGIGYSYAHGSYVLPPLQRRTAINGPTAGTILREMFGGVPAAPSDSHPAYRSRLIGVFDAMRNIPLGDVAVISDTLNKQTLTTPSGAASLFFLPEGLSRIRVSKAGYRDTSFAVTISPFDTIPITVLLEVSDTSRRSPRHLH